MRQFIMPFLLPTMVLAVGPSKPRKAATSVHSPKEARAIAERETGGTAVTARRIPLNGATGGWEVEVHMPGEDRGWRCIIDADTHMVYTKERIPNPPTGRRKK